MAYKLTLTADERKAIDWIGDRYHNGNDLYRLLWAQSAQEPNDADWDDPRPIEFTIPENVAWQIWDNAEMENSRWPCFGRDLCAKLDAFLDSIV